MAQRRGKPLSDYDFSFEPRDPLPVRFAKTICQGLVELGLPGWVYLVKSYKADCGMFKGVGGGPSLATAVSKFRHIHWVEAKRIKVGFQYEGPHNELPLELRVNWRKLQDELKSATGIDYGDTTGRNWPRLQFHHYYSSLFLEDPEERRVLIDNTKTALEVAGGVFGW